MKNKLQNNLSELKKFNQQRKLWLALSFFVIVSVTSIIFDWNQIKEYKLEWTLGTFGMVTAIGWWYWTMKIIRHLIQHKTDEYEILEEIVTEIKSIKQGVQKSLSDNVDKDK